MNTSEIRSKYLKFFEARGHKIIPAAPLVLENDPTTLFTSSGMQPLVSYLMGEEHPQGKKLVDSQPSIRVQDIDEVGDNRHTTFFEMLGNWSLGDYFKAEQLPWIWEFLTVELGLPKEKLYVSIFEGNGSVPRDSESFEIWKSLGVPEDHIFEYGVAKNWWSRSGTPEQMPEGEIGGPDSEIFFEFDSVEHDPKFGDKCHPNCDCGRFLEIGNSVFIQYKKLGSGTLEELPQKNVDFGGGLERLTAAVNNDPDVFKIDIFQAIISRISNLSGKSYRDNETSMRIMADHFRAAVFLASNGVEPSNKKQGYVMRRLLRRLAIKSKQFGMFLIADTINDLVDSIFNIYIDDILDKDQKENVKRIINLEIAKFSSTLAKGMREIEKLEKVDGQEAFNLFQTYGFPLELTLELALEKGQQVDVAEFKKAFEAHQEKSRSASAGVFKGGLADHSQEVIRLHTAHHLLLAALQQTLESQIRQKGSNITSERLRLDFNFDRKLTDEEISRVENLLNEKIGEDLPVTKKIMPREEAQNLGAQMEFGKKYPEQVSIYFIGNENAPFSMEFCGGPHVEHLSQIGGRVKIIKEESLGANTRRIYAQISNSPANE